MANYSDEAEASAAGLRIVHEPNQHRFAVYQSEPQGDRLVGEAHYSLIEDSIIDFDHTVVLPELRGSGIATLLAQRALDPEVIGSRRVHASCWFITGYLKRHPEALPSA
ncbi:N-acetyltransferase [Leucobacter insecticola]|uniref:N-acetyltransferase n=1 Tax=Leucobacter insecticola TaxID=2714934 RepID=A0A6G8FL74_9MICO|nr:GNAT family N-acetyltransferase [Leucobacter insecticola]QIM16832.1 N-acetyltransferase [Leucobacter insecticola]